MRLRVLLDTNVLVAAFATRGLCEDVFRAVIGKHQLLTSPAILSEFERALQTKLRFPHVEVQRAVNFVVDQSELVSPSTPASWPIEDKDDRWVVAGAAHGRADVLVTGDKQLIAESRGRSLQVVSPRSFWAMLQEQE